MIKETFDEWKLMLVIFLMALICFTLANMVLYHMTSAPNNPYVFVTVIIIELTLSVSFVLFLLIIRKERIEKIKNDRLNLYKSSNKLNS